MTSPVSAPALSVNSLLAEFEDRSGLTGLITETKNRSDGQVLIIHVANPTERLYRILEEIQKRHAGDEPPQVRATLKKARPEKLLQAPEAKLLLKTLSESLTINRHSFGNDFFGRYIKSMTGAEEQIVSAGNHVVFGRRGSGKSSLLLYAMHTRTQRDLPFAWVDMQVYAQRADNAVVIDVLYDILEQAEPHLRNALGVENIRARLDALKALDAPTDSQIRQLLPDLKRVFGSLPNDYPDFAIFLDDFYVIATSLQPKLLHFLYAFSRGNKISLKLSAIETFTKLWDPATRVGLEIPHDVQTIKLDYNLTVPDKASQHIRSILDAHAAFCGLPSARALCNDDAVLSRLVWVAAGVPRDALNLFSQAMTKAAVKNQARITVTNINIAASETVNDKMRDVELDASGAFDQANRLLDEIRDFCIKKEKKNAFLVEVLNDDPTFMGIRQLMDLRLLHVIHEGITRHDAGRKFMALILDYGFYIGVRAARSVDLFNKSSQAGKYEELRDLPVFRVGMAAAKA